MATFIRNVTVVDVMITVNGISVSIKASSIAYVNDIFNVYFDPINVILTDQAIVNGLRAILSVITTATGIQPPYNPTGIGNTNYTTGRNAIYYLLVG